ncbi:MAG: AAA family ATPase, partial [Oscillospiraceae bacterium]|nr:AAA family ATPase [Candidatus Equicaccousia limihippi]
DNVRVLIEGKYRATFSGLDTVKNCLMADVTRIFDVVTPKKRSYTDSALRKVKTEFERFASLSPKMPKDILYTVVSNNDPLSLSDFISSNVQFKPDDKQEILEELNVLKRLRLISTLLALESDIIEVDNRINDKAKEYIDENQKEYYLKEQLHAISNELYGDDGIEAEVDEYYDKIEKLNAPKEAKDVMCEEVRKLFKMPVGSQEAAVVRNYLDLLVSLPFGVYTKTSSDIEKALKLLNKEHYGLSDVKERFTEIMAVLKLNPDYKGQIICLVGPPGVGKTSVARSLAKAMGRNFARVSLGGVSDEAEINGHRRTYIGAMPGRIIKAVKQSKSANPLILLDEIDKMTVSNHGDPSASLLEVLDSEQNYAYVDKYVDMPFDLSKVVFLCTANNADNIPAPLYDRMDIITLPGYTRLDKSNIAHNHLIKKQMAQCGLTPKTFRIDRAAVFAIIDFYTREAGVRSLE